MKERFQVQFDEDDLAAVRRVAAAEGRSVAALIREATVAYLAAHEVAPETAWERAIGLAGAFASDARPGRSDVGRRHDRYLPDAFSG